MVSGNKGIVWAAGLVVVTGVIFGLVQQNRGPSVSKASETVARDSNHIPGTGTEVRTNSNRSSAVAWSSAEDAKTAVREAVAKMRAGLGGKEPSFVLASFTVLYDKQAIVQALCAELGPKVQIHGLTTAAGLMTNDGLHIGRVFGLLGVASNEVAFGVGEADPDWSSSLEDAGRNAILQAIANAGHQPTEKPDIILFSASMRRGGEFKLLDGIASVVGQDTPVLGGNSGDEKFDGSWSQFTQNGLYTSGLVVTAVYSKSKIGWAFENGFRITDKTGIVTKSDGKTLYEIDNRPAFDVYNEWLNGALVDYIKAKGHWDIAGWTAQYPLCKVLHGPNGQVGYMTSHPVPKEEDVINKTVPVYALIEEGSRIQLFSGTWQTIMNRAELAPANALIRGDIARNDALCGFLFFCGGAYNCIPEAERTKLPLLVNNAIGDVPFIGMITAGEQGYIPGVRNVSANLVESMVVVGNH